MADYEGIRDPPSQKYFQEGREITAITQATLPELGFYREEKELPLLRKMFP